MGPRHPSAWPVLQRVSLPLSPELQHRRGICWPTGELSTLCNLIYSHLSYRPCSHLSSLVSFPSGPSIHSSIHSSASDPQAHQSGLLIIQVWPSFSYFPSHSRGKSHTPTFNPWVGKIPGRRKWEPTPVLLPGKSHGQRSLVGCSPWGR